MAGAELLGLGAGFLSNFITNDTNQTINRQQMQNQHSLLAIQQGFAAEQAEKADQRTRALFTDFMTPEARRKQLEEAGLSVGMMYGAGGSGGSMTSGAQAASPSPTSANAIAMHPLGMEAAAILQNIKKTEAETKNIEQQTEESEAREQSTWRDIPVKEKQLIVMDHTINKIDEEIAEIQQRVQNMTEEKLNIIASRENIEKDTKLKEEQASLTKAQKEYNESLKELTDIQIKWQDNISEAQVNEYKANAANLYASAKKLGVETETLKKTQNYLVSKTIFESMSAAVEANLIKPEEANLIQKRIQATDDANKKAELWLNWVKEHPKMYNLHMQNTYMFNALFPQGFNPQN